jgi:TonB family protein
MKMKTVICALSILMFFDVAVLPAQDWLPTRIVGIDYPVLAIQAGISGTVRIKCILDEDGKVLSAEILGVGPSNGIRSLLAPAAQQNALRWVFSKSNPVAQQQRSTVITYDFRFEANPNPNYLRSRFIFDFPQSVHIIADMAPPEIQITKPNGKQ